MLHSLVSRSRSSSSDDDRSFRNLPEFNGKGFYVFKAKFLAWLRVKGLEDVLLPKKSKKKPVVPNAAAVVNVEEASQVNEEAAEEQEEEEEQNENKEAEDANENEDQADGRANSIPKRRHERRSIHGTTRRIL